MANVKLGSSYKNFMSTKGIQRAYNFVVNFHNLSGGIDKFKISHHKDILTEKTLRASHIKNVTVPTYQFKSEGQDFGPFLRAVPVLDRQPLNITIEMEEDDQHTIGYFIQYLQNEMMNEFGVYRPVYYDASRLKLKIVIEIFRADGTKVVDYSYYNCFLQTVSESTYDYTANTAVSNTLTFISDFYSTKYYDNEPETNLRPELGHTRGVLGILDRL